MPPCIVPPADPGAECVPEMIELSLRSVSVLYHPPEVINVGQDTDASILEGSGYEGGNKISAFSLETHKRPVRWVQW